MATLLTRQDAAKEKKRAQHSILHHRNQRSSRTQLKLALQLKLAMHQGTQPLPQCYLSASAPTGSDAVVDVEMTAGISDAGSPDAAGHGAVHGPNPNQWIGREWRSKKRNDKAQERARRRAQPEGRVSWASLDACPDHAPAL